MDGDLKREKKGFHLMLERV